MKLLLENVRSFDGKHTLPIAPLTVLVGENSSGKTTCLAMLSAIFSAPGFPSRPAFNEPPFDLGGYDTIATYKGGKYGRAKHFSLGYVADSQGSPNPTELLATYKSSLGQPILAALSVKRNGASLTLAFSDERVTGRLTMPKLGNFSPVDLPIDRQLPEGRLLTLHTLAQATYGLLTEPKAPGAFAHHLIDFLDNIPTFQTIAVAPVRTKPKRTYDPVSDEFRPEGDHIPLILARALSVTSSTKERDQLKDALTKFGDTLGLFTEVKVKKLGKSPSDPFQILVAVAGRPYNLSDVGYGVSQSLPVIVESTLGSRSRLLLLQQPEVHLHPRAQAALGSFFTQLAATQQKRFVIETHSDYLIDRVRQEVANGTIDPDLVRIVFFERAHSESRMHLLSLDKHGNILDAPMSYRDFFLREEESLLKRTQPQH